MANICPVCESDVDDSRERDYGDKKLVFCPRCGAFEISGTALSMLSSRVNDDPKARARLSHAIRTETTESKHLFVGSTNLDELVQRALPGVEQQLEYLLKWLATQLGDDHLGQIPIPPFDSLAGLVGAVDGDRISRLIAHAQKSGFLIIDTNKMTFGISPEGLKVTEPPQEKIGLDKKLEQETKQPDIITAHCNKCGGDLRWSRFVGQVGSAVKVYSSV